MKFIKKIATFYHYSSFDVVLGAVASSWAFWKLPNGSEKPSVAALLILGCVTWFLYILDRLLDIRVYPPNHTPRHSFHLQHQYNLQVLGIVLFLFSAGLAFVLPKALFRYGVVVAIGVGMYYWVLNKYLKNEHFQWIKEPVTALFYTLAVVGTVLVSKPSISLSTWILAFNFFLITLQCIIVFSYFEKMQSIDNKTIVDFIGEKNAARSIRVVSIAVVFINSFLFSGGSGYPSLLAYIEIAMTLVLSFLAAQPDYFLKNEKYRWIGEAVFLFPALLLGF